MEVEFSWRKKLLQGVVSLEGRPGSQLETAVLVLILMGAGNNTASWSWTVCLEQLCKRPGGKKYFFLAKNLPCGAEFSGAPGGQTSERATGFGF